MRAHFYFISLSLSPSFSFSLSLSLSLCVHHCDFYSTFSFISPGCPLPSIALQMQNCGLKHCYSIDRSPLLCHSIIACFLSVSLSKFTTMIVTDFLCFSVPGSRRFFPLSDLWSIIPEQAWITVSWEQSSGRLSVPMSLLQQGYNGEHLVKDTHSQTYRSGRVYVCQVQGKFCECQRLSAAFRSL